MSTKPTTGCSPAELRISGGLEEEESGDVVAGVAELTHVKRETVQVHAKTPFTSWNWKFERQYESHVSRLVMPESPQMFALGAAVGVGVGVGELGVGVGELGVGVGVGVGEEA